jgi:hypothetical protein
MYMASRGFFFFFKADSRMRASFDWTPGPVCFMAIWKQDASCRGLAAKDANGSQWFSFEQ